ncbi:hypothetical protein ACROYT_G023482 [Oculina patagonica]
MGEAEVISPNRKFIDALTSQERRLDEDYHCVDELSARRFIVERFEETLDFLQLAKVEKAQRSLQTAYRPLLKLSPNSFSNPTDHEKQQLERGREMSIRCVTGPPFCGVILLDQVDSNQDDYFYIKFTNVFGTLALKLHEHCIAIEVFKLAVKSIDTDTHPHRVIEEHFDFSVSIAKTNMACVYLIMRKLDEAKETLECALESLERFKEEKSTVTVEINIFAAQNNLSLVLQVQQNYPAALKLHNYLVSRTRNLNLPIHMVLALHYNRLDFLLELRDPGKALTELEEIKSLSLTAIEKYGIPEEYIFSKICLVFLTNGKLDRAEAIAEKVSLSFAFSSSLPSTQSPWSTSSSSLSSSLSSSSTSSSSSSSSSPPSSEFEEFLTLNEKLPWDFLVATILNLIDFHLFQENLESVSMFLDGLLPGCKETFGISHPTFASLRYRQGVKLSLMGQNVPSKHCFEEALGTFTKIGFASSHPEVARCNEALARLLLRQGFQEKSFLNSQSVKGAQSDFVEPSNETTVFEFPDSNTSSSLFRKFTKHIIKSEEKVGEISEFAMSEKLLKLQGPSIGQIKVWPHDRCIKISTQPTHPKQSSEIKKVLIEEMKMCASALGVPPSRVKLLNRDLKVIGSQEEVPFLKECSKDDWQEDLAHDVTDGVVNSEDPPFQDVFDSQDHNGESHRQQPIQQPNKGKSKSRKVDELVKVPKKDGDKRGLGVPRKKDENPSLVFNEAKNRINSSCVGECAVADDGANYHSNAVNGACGYQSNWHLQAVDNPQDGKEDKECGSKRNVKRTLGLKGGRRDEFASNYSFYDADKAYTSESSYLGIEPDFLARHTNDDSMSLNYNSCKMGETEERFCKFPDCPECFSRNTASATATALMSPAQTPLNPNGYQPQQSFIDSYNGQFSIPEVDANWNLPPPPPPFPSLPYDVPKERHYLSENHFAIGTVQSRTSRYIDPVGGFTLLPNRNDVGGQNIQTEIRQSAFSVIPTSTTQNAVSLQAEAALSSERATRPEERERIDREMATATAFTNGESSTMQPGLVDSNSHTSDDDSLAALERRVAEACSLVERVLKEREEREKTIKERERRQREERTQRELQERERREREARELKQSGEGTSTRSEEEAPSQHTALPESPQWLCEHYQRLCRVKFPCCGRFYPCHRCHNNSDECVNDNCKAKEAFYLECSVCRHQQAINQDAQTCARCKTKMSAYFCSICKHFTGEDKYPYHCTKCGICRIHKDRSFHCDVCNVCLDKRLQGKHKCRANSGHDECCICLEDAFSGCQILPCSHKVHRECAIAMIQNGVRSCPICRHPLYSQTGGTE